MTTLQDIMGLITKRKIKTPTDNDYIISAAYTNTQERLKPQPKMEANLINIGELKKYIGGSGGTSNLESITIDSNIGSRLKPTDPLINGFYVNRNVNGAVGYLALNTDTGNAAVAAHGVGIDSNSYIKNMLIAKFGPNYFVSLLAGKGGLLGTEEVFVGSTNGGDVSVVTGATFGAMTRKFRVKANGQIDILVDPILTGGYTAPFDLLTRDPSGAVYKIKAMIPEKECKIAMNLDGTHAGDYYNKGFSGGFFGGNSGTVWNVTLGVGTFNGTGYTEVYFQLTAQPGYTLIPTVTSIVGNTVEYTLAAIDNNTGTFIILDSANASSCIQGYINIIIKQ